MPQKSSGTSYTGKPVRRLKLPKIGPTKTPSLFEEHSYALLAVVFFAVTILGKAGGFSAYNALVTGAWVTALVWCASQLKGYFAEKSSKAENGKTAGPPVEERAETPKRPLPPGMKPMIGPQWPVTPGARPAWPKLPKQTPATPGSAISEVPNSAASASPAAPGSDTGLGEKKRGFVYERPTLPDRKPKLPNNWIGPDGKKPSHKNLNHKKPKR